MVKVELGDSRARDFLCTWKENGGARAPVIDDGENGVMSVGLRQADDKVHSYLLEG